MPDPVTVTRAELRELKPDGTEVKPPKKVQVQFNPETLKVTYSNQVVPPANGGAQPQGKKAAIQYVGKGTTKLSVQLWFDVTARLPEGADSTIDDVRLLTRDVAYFITPVPDKKDKTKFIPPGVRFLWGSFQFDGILESLDESLEYFSPEGKPLRASMTLSLTQQEIQFQFGDAAAKPPPAAAGAGKKPPSGTQPLTQAPGGSNMPGLADAAGHGGNWQGIAAANGIENPRLLDAGALIDMNASVGVGLSVGASLDVGLGASASFSGPSLDLGASASLSASGSSLDLEASASASASVSASASASVSTSASASIAGPSLESSVTGPRVSGSFQL
jgi:hypothetical protein